MKAWTFQDPKQVKKVGEEAASWYVGWVDPDGRRKCKSYGPGPKGKRLAEQEKEKVSAQLLTGTYQCVARKTWAQFREDYEGKVVAGLSPRTRDEVRHALDAFERVVKPAKVSSVKTATVDAFIARRLQERGKKKGAKVSPATVNKDLRHLRAALRKAKKWEYLTAVPDFAFVREPGKLARYVTPEHFARLYEACETAAMPEGLPYPPAAWWRGLLVFAYMTGWRISEILNLLREDLDLADGFAITRAEDNKGKREERVALHPVALEHLKALPAFDTHVFPWDRDRKVLQGEFARIQEAAGISLQCRGRHEHTRFCHVYGFHDLRRAFATQNADRLTADALQKLMRHKSYATTQRYINMTRQLDDAVANLHVPDFLRKKAGGQ